MATTPKRDDERPISPEEQLLRRQSAPTPGEEEYLLAAQQELADREMQAVMRDPQAALSGGGTGGGYGAPAAAGPIGVEQIREAYQTMQKYRQGKANLERRIVENEEWYKLHQWGVLPDDKQDVMPTSAWLFNCIANKHADAMENYPMPNILPREEGDKAEAEALTAIIPVVLDQNDFEQTYSDVMTYKIKSGTGVYGVFWDQEKLNGLGDISVVKIDLLNLFWEPGITDIQKSAHLFHVDLVDNDALINDYPQLARNISTPSIDVAQYVYDDTVDTSEKSVVVDWYYRRKIDGRTVLHYCKFCNDEVLFASENDPKYAERGWYDHGMYPFVFDPLYEVEGSPAGFGYIDIGKGPQTYISRIDQAIAKNALANAAPRYFSSNSGSINEAEFTDLTREIVHVEGTLNETSIAPITPNQLPQIYYEILQGKINELKETTGNRDVNTGGSTSGVTAASAIAAMQEAGGKLSRDNSKASYRAYRRMINLVIELIRQFYDLPRKFRILGENGTQKYIMYSNAGIKPQPYEMNFGLAAMQEQIRVPLFDVAVSAQKANPYSKMAQNELAMQLYSAGLFNPAVYDQALLCLDMMDFDHKDELMQKIAENGMIYQQAMAASMAAGMAPAGEEESGGEPWSGKQGQKEHNKNKGEVDELGGYKPAESPVTRKAREKSAQTVSAT